MRSKEQVTCLTLQEHDDDDDDDDIYIYIYKTGIEVKDEILPVHVMKLATSEGGVGGEVQLHVLLTFAQFGCERSASHLSRFT